MKHWLGNFSVCGKPLPFEIWPSQPGLIGENMSPNCSPIRVIMIYIISSITFTHTHSYYLCCCQTFWSFPIWKMKWFSQCSFLFLISENKQLFICFRRSFASYAMHSLHTLAHFSVKFMVLGYWSAGSLYILENPGLPLWYYIACKHLVVNLMFVFWFYLSYT